MDGSTITLPKKLFEDLVQATDYFEHIQSELEDFVLSHDAAFLTKMRKARRDHVKNKFSDWAKLRRRYGL